MRAMGIKYKTSTLLSHSCSVSIWAGCLLLYSTMLARSIHTWMCVCVICFVPWVNIFSLDYVTDYHKFRFWCCCFFFFCSSSWILFDKLSVRNLDLQFTRAHTHTICMHQASIASIHPFNIQRCVTTINISLWHQNAENVKFIDSYWNQIPFYSSHTSTISEGERGKSPNCANLTNV